MPDTAEFIRREKIAQILSNLFVTYFFLNKRNQLLKIFICSFARPLLYYLIVKRVSFYKKVLNVVEITAGNCFVFLVAVSYGHQLIGKHGLNRLTYCKAFYFLKKLRFIDIGFYDFVDDAQLHSVSGVLRRVVFQDEIELSFGLLFDREIQVFKKR